MFLAVMTSAAIALGLVAAGYAASPPARHPAATVGQAMPARPSGIRVNCIHPDALRLIRFEDGSARLNCGRRILVRVSVPG